MGPSGTNVLKKSSCTSPRRSNRCDGEPCSKMSGRDSSSKTKEKRGSYEVLLYKHLPPKSARCYQQVEMEVVKTSRSLSNQQGGVELRLGERREEKTVEMTLGETNHQGKVTESNTTFPAFGLLLNTGFVPTYRSDSVRRSCRIPFLHMQYSALATWNTGLGLKLYERGVGGNCCTATASRILTIYHCHSSLLILYVGSLVCLFAAREGGSPAWTDLAFLLRCLA